MQFVARFENGDRRLISVVKTREGELIDWDAFARYGTACWDDIMNGKVQTATVRVFLQKTNYYNFAYSDDEKWASYRLSSPDLDSELTAYAAIGTRTHGILDHTFTLAPHPRRFTLRIQIDPSHIQKKTTHHQPHRSSRLGRWRSGF